MTDTSTDAVERMAEKFTSQVGDDIQRIYDHEALFKEGAATLRALSSKLDAARQALEYDRTKVIEACNTFSDAFQRRSWILDGRGPYEWDDDKYRDEFRQAYDELSKPIEVLRKIGRDWSNCPETQSEADAARQNPHDRAVKAEAERDAANQRAEMLANSQATARAEGKAEGLREAANVCKYNSAEWDITSKSHKLAKWSLNIGCAHVGHTYETAILALIPASPVCDTKPAENARVTVQEAAKVLLDLLQTPSEKAPIEPRCIEDIWAATFRESGFFAVTGFLRAIAGGNDE